MVNYECCFGSAVLNIVYYDTGKVATGSGVFILNVTQFFCCSVTTCTKSVFFLLIIFQEIFKDVFKCMQSLFDLSR